MKTTHREVEILGGHKTNKLQSLQQFIYTTHCLEISLTSGAGKGMMGSATDSPLTRPKRGPKKLIVYSSHHAVLP